MLTRPKLIEPFQIVRICERACGHGAALQGFLADAPGEILGNSPHVLVAKGCMRVRMAIRCNECQGARHSHN